MAKVFIFYKDADYILFQKKGLIGFLGPLFCSYWVVLEARQVRVRVPPEEKAEAAKTASFKAKDWDSAVDWILKKGRR